MLAVASPHKYHIFVKHAYVVLTGFHKNHSRMIQVMKLSL